MMQKNRNEESYALHGLESFHAAKVLEAAGETEPAIFIRQKDPGRIDLEIEHYDEGYGFEMNIENYSGESIGDKFAHYVLRKPGKVSGTLEEESSVLDELAEDYGVISDKEVTAK
ncbi:MAG: hypothetical protein H8Z69_04970 [Nanohaloarchaea archaeon]|nr:hypothetical protein [Candidatus Nanohaloarchaea archaeon]